MYTSSITAVPENVLMEENETGVEHYTESSSPFLLEGIHIGPLEHGG